MNRPLAGSILGLSTLALACFVGLAADPAALLVDADRPSLDHAWPIGEAPVGNDLTRLFLPHHLAIARSIARDGHLPFWDDRGFGGRPLVGNPQAGLFYPPTWLVWWSGVPASLGWITVGHLLFAGRGVCRLGRTLGMGGWGSLVAAGCFQASPYVLAQVFEGHHPHVWAACWYPWAFDAAIRLRRGEPRAALVLSAALAATLLAGHPQEGFYLIVTLGLWALFEGFADLRAGRRREARRLWLAWAVALVLAAGLIAVELIPDMMAQPWCLRGARLPLRLASRYHLYPINALQLLSPRALGGPADYFGHENYWESVTSIGLIPLVLAIVAVAWSTDRRGVRGWSILVGASVLFASGWRLGLFALLYEVVPGIDRFRVPARSLFLASLGGSILAGMGVEALRARSGDDRAWARLARRFGLIVVLIVAAVEIGGRADPAGSIRVNEADRLRLGLGRLAADPIFLTALGGSALLLAVAWLRPSHRQAVVAALGLFGLVELGSYGHGLIVTSAAERFLGPDPISVGLELARPPGPGPTRIRVEGSIYDDLRAGEAGFAKTDVNDSFQIQHAADLYQSLYPRFGLRRARRGPPSPDDIRHRSLERQGVLDRMAVPLLVRDHVDSEAPWWSLVASGTWRGSPYAIERNPTALPRAYVVPKAMPGPDDASIVARFTEVDPRQAVVMAADPLGPETSARQPFTPAEWTSTDPDRVVVQVATTAPGLLVVADTWMPGWTAEVDGLPQPVLRGNRAHRVIPLPQPGPHQVILTYRPPGLSLGLAVTVASAAIWTSLLLVSTLRRRRLSDACR